MRLSRVLPLLLLVLGLVGAGPVAAAVAAPPAMTALPALSGPNRVTQKLASTTGTWTSTSPIQYTRRWVRCDADGLSCATIPYAAGADHTLVPADQDSTVRVVVTATNNDGSTSATSPASPVIGPAQPPVATALPSVAGVARDGQTLTGDQGTWTGAPTITYARRWVRCDASGNACAALTATTPTYTPAAADVGSTLRHQVTATGPDGVKTEWSAPTAVVAGNPPANTVAPSTGGTVREGQTLTLANPGTWTGTTPIAFTRRWERCDAGGGACVPIADATATSHTLSADDVGARVRVVVTATNGQASVDAASAATVVVPPKAPPVATTAPSIAGTPRDGVALTASAGTWSGTPTIQTPLRWQRCDAGGADCVTLGSTSATLTPGAADVGMTFRVQVTATNPDGTTVETSAATAPVLPALPSNTALPAVSGTARQGTTLSLSSGTWKGTPAITYDFAWERCSPGCAAIPSATASTYRLTVADVGATVRGVVIATNAAGSASATTAPTATVAASPPVATTAPSIAGAVLRDGEVLTGDLGVWESTSSVTYTRQWQRCGATGQACAAIPGAVDDTYALTAADVDRTVRFEVTALNALGSTKVASAATGVVVAAPPSATDGPRLQGPRGAAALVAPRDREVLEVEQTWAGTAPIAFTYTWERCDTAVVPLCSVVTGATTSAYTLTAADVGRRLRVKVAAQNAGGGASATTALTDVVAEDPARATGQPAISGTPEEGATLTASGGSFTGTPPITRTWVWERCDSAGDACAPTGVTSATYLLGSADVGSTLRATVTGSTPTGSDSTTSPVTAVVGYAPPRAKVAPAVSPDTGLRDGRLLTSTGGGWTGSAPLELAYRWQRCTAKGDACADITGAAGTEYRLTTADVGFTLRSVVTASNGAGSASQSSPATAIVGTNPPVEVSAPSVARPPTAIGPAPRDGETLRIVDGDWTGLVPMTSAYRWWRCDAAGANCSLIPGATSVTYALTPPDVGVTVRGEVIRSNAGGATGALSAATALVVAAAPENLTAPQVGGAAAVGKTVEALHGDWAGTPLLDFAYQWERCAADGTGCLPIAGANGQEYRLVAADDGGSVRVIVTATNDVGTASATSPPTSEVVDDPPVNLVAPSISSPGLVAQGTVLTAQAGTWTGALPMTYAYQWRRCDLALASCVDVAGATTAAYALAKDDVGKRIVLTVRATNVVDVGTATSSGTPAVLVEPPSGMTPPVVTASGSVQDGVKLTATAGTWKGALPMTYRTTWLRCASDGTACAPIPDAVGSTYVLASADVGARLRARVTATNAAAEAFQDSAATSAVDAAPPVSSARPAVVALDGKARVGGRLRATAGAFKGTAPMTVRMQWQRCVGSTTAACDDVPGATSTEYQLGEADVGRRMRVLVVAENDGGTGIADSPPTEAVPAVAPENAAPPRVVAGGPVREGTELRAEPGTWTGSAPIALLYQWERCPLQGAPTCAKITGATKAAYTLVAADVGKFVRVAVTASNAGGRNLRASSETDEVAGVAPRVTDPPVASLKGGVKVGATVTATTGKWAGTAPLKYDTQWQRCDARGLACTDITSATKPTYVLKAEDVSGAVLAAPIRAVVTATNVAGTAEVATVALSGSGTPMTGGGGGAGPGASGGGGAGGGRRAKPARKSKVLAQLRAVRLDAKAGALLIDLVCPRRSRDTCGVVGSIAASSIRSGLKANGMKKGATQRVTLLLRTKDRRALKGRASLRALLRMAAPATPTRAKTRRVVVRVPEALSGVVKQAVPKRKAAPKRRTAAKRKTAAAKRKPAAKRKKAAAKRKPAARRRSSSRDGAAAPEAPDAGAVAAPAA